MDRRVFSVQVGSHVGLWVERRVLVVGVDVPLERSSEGVRKARAAAFEPARAFPAVEDVWTVVEAPGDLQAGEVVVAAPSAVGLARAGSGGRGAQGSKEQHLAVPDAAASPAAAETSVQGEGEGVSPRHEPRRPRGEGEVPEAE